MIRYSKKRVLEGSKPVNTYVLEWYPQSRKVTLTEKEAREVVENLTKLLKK